jgi:hypothetical protein
MADNALLITFAIALEPATTAVKIVAKTSAYSSRS